MFLKEINALNNGAIMAYPTESVWGLGCKPASENAFRKLLAIKNRPADKGVILVAGSMDQVTQYTESANLPPSTWNSIETAWLNQMNKRQAITFLLPASQLVPSWITGQHGSVAIRLSPHSLVQHLCLALDSALVSTSCNPSGEPPAITLKQARHYFGDQIGYIEGQTLGFDKPSKIIDPITGNVLR